MEIKNGVISVDDHVMEHPEVWTSRMSKSKWGDRAPHIERHSNGTESWVVDGQPLDLQGAGSPGIAAVGAALSDRVAEPQRWEEVPKVAYVPEERLKAMDVDGIDASALYPTVAGLAGETFGRSGDPEFELACVQAYNDWLIEEWASASDRFIPQCIVPIYPLEATVAEIKRAVGKGHKGVIFPAIPMHLREVPHINEPEYDLLWSTCVDLGVPICFHAGSSTQIQFPAYEGLSSGLASALRNITRPVSSVIPVANFLYSKILMRFKQLKAVFSETSLTWVAYELETADHQFERQRLIQEGYTMRPSEMSKQSCYYTGWYDKTGIDTRKYIGMDNILWGTSFPLGTSTWPKSRDYIARAFEGVSEAEKRQILVGNAAALYKV